MYCGVIETGEKFEKGILTWPKTLVGTRVNITCPYNDDDEANAYRWCRMNMTTMTQYWDVVHDESCIVLERNMTFDKLNEVIGRFWF